MTFVKEAILGIIIAIIFFMFCMFGAKLIYDSPDYGDYCDNDYYNSYEKPLNTSQLDEREATQKECREEYELAREPYSKNMFIASLIFGILVILACAIFIDISSISGGLMFGSLIFILYGTGGYWEYMDDLLRFLILGAGLALLIYVAYWLNKKKK